MQWTVVFFEGVNDEIRALPVGLRTRVLRLVELVETFGLDQLREPHVKHLEGKLWELRAKAPEGVARGLYVTTSGRKVVVLHVFEKKSDKTPARALALARDRMKRVMT